MPLRTFTRRHGLIGVFVDEFIKREAASVHNLERAEKRFFVAFKEPRHFGWALQMPLGIGFELQTSFRNRRVLADAGQHIL